MSPDAFVETESGHRLGFWKFKRPSSWPVASLTNHDDMLQRIERMDPPSHITEIGGQKVNDLYFRRGLLYGERRERSRLVGNLRRAYQRGQRDGMSRALAVAAGLVAVAWWLGRGRV